MKIADIIKSFISGDWGNEAPTEETSNAVYCVRGADIVPVSNNDFSNIPLRYISDKSIESRLLQSGDIVVEKSGGSPTQSTGRVVFISDELINAKSHVVCSNFCTAFRVKDGWNPYFVYQYWQYVYNAGVFFNFEGKTSGLRNLQIDNALSSIPIEHYPISYQNSISAVLASIEDKIHLNRSINDNLAMLGRSSGEAKARLAA